MTQTEYDAAKFSFSRVPETCPLVDAKLAQFLDTHKIPDDTRHDLKELIDFAKSKNEQLRELTFIMGRQAIEAGVALR